MKTILQGNRLVLMAQTEGEQAALAQWRSVHADSVFAVSRRPDAREEGDPTLVLVALGRREEVCREPINVTSFSPEPIRLIANFAPTPFELDGLHYACVEAFWQSLRFPLEERPRIAGLDGVAAKRESSKAPYTGHVIYAGREVPVGAFDHWQLMRRACRAKFEQNGDARLALLGTGTRPLIHKLRQDSRTIPGVIMADIWMSLRGRFARHRARQPKKSPDGGA